MTKINDILLNIPAHTVMTTKWLEKLGISRQLLSKYTKSKWFEYIAKGAVKRYGDKLSLYGAVYALQKQLLLPVHIGARSALELQGLAHNIRVGAHNTFLLKHKASIQLPSWFKINFSKVIIFKSCPIDIPLKTMDNEQIIRLQPTNSLINNALIDFNCGDYAIKVASPELAILESCYLIPSNQSFEECYNIVTGLVGLRPNIMQDLLVHCNSLRAKRLFLFMAFKAAIPLVKHLDLSKINLGTGRIQVVQNGVFDSKFLITVPHIFKDNSDANNPELLF